MKKYFTYIIISIFSISCIYAQKDIQNEKYKRSSLYSFLISHPKVKMNNEITSAYLALTTPDKFNNHDLSVKCVTSSKKREDVEAVSKFLKKNEVAKRLVSKWFNRDKKSGVFDVSLITSRGEYNATKLDLEKAIHSERGVAILADAGEELIGKTFVTVNDITYIDKEARAQIAKQIFSVIGSFAGEMGGSIGDIVESAAQLSESISDQIAGFTVNVSTYLYQLDWNDEVAAKFYQDYYFDVNASSPNKMLGYDSDQDLFKLKYIGSYTAKSTKTVIKGISKPEDVFRKVCARALDNNIVALQHRYDEFKVKEPLFSVTPSITAKIGMKEGVAENSKFEVLEKSLDQNGKTIYKKVGVIAPEKKKIWDNRFMAVEEQADGANLTATTFRKVSGGDFYVGMLIREIK